MLYYHIIHHQNTLLEKRKNYTGRTNYLNNNIIMLGCENTRMEEGKNTQTQKTQKTQKCKSTRIFFIWKSRNLKNTVEQCHIYV